MPAPSGKTTIVGSLSSRLSELGIAIYVIDAEGEKIPHKDGPGITRFDLVVINKIDLAPVGVACRAFSAYPLQ